jgi:preprotein translocase subunit SecA
MFKFLSKLLDTNERELKKLRLVVAEINQLEKTTAKLKTKDFAKKTQEFKERLGKGESLDNLLNEAYALGREAAKRMIKLRPFDEQLMAAICFHQGKIAEQKTGEGKTLSAVPALYLNALAGKGCHLVTVNDYLARRDAGWNGPAFHLLGVSVGAIIHEQAYLFDPEFTDNSVEDKRLTHLKPVSRQEAYAAEITYGTNNEFGFDYLRDNMVQGLEQMVQRGHNFAIVDEVDSILIDEARTPLIISAPDTEPTSKYYTFAGLINQLSADTDYVIDEKHKTANLTEHGVKKVEVKLGVDNLYEKDFDTLHHIEQALRARTLFHRDTDYVVKEGEVIIVDEFTGRLMFGRRYSEGLHQAIEAKENVEIKQESKTLATISFQNYFRMYKKLAGMTGTAATEAEEFQRIYNLETVVVPTHEPMIRKDFSDVVYKTTRAKYAAIVKEVSQRHSKGQPILIGTPSIDKNQIIDEFLKRKKIPHQVLNAKNHLKEAMIIAQAGKVGSVTVATNMAGRGVDIILGGDPGVRRDKKDWQKEHNQVVKLGGLHVTGIERHEARRIDNQLRGRSGRQGDPGSSRFYVSLEDDIMRIFGGEQIARLMTAFKMPEDVPLEHAMVSKAIEQAQTKVESFHFDQRKHLVEYDDVMNKQREIIYKKRRQILEPNQKKSLKEKILEILGAEVGHLVELNLKPETGQIDDDKLIKDFVMIVPFEPNSQQRIQQELKKHGGQEATNQFLQGVVEKTYAQREKEVGSGLMREIEKFVMLSTIDHLWIDHLDAIDDLREGIGLRGYAQRDPLVEYKAEAFAMFERLVANIDYEVARKIFRIQVSQRPPTPMPTEQAQELKPEAAKPTTAASPAPSPAPTPSPTPSPSPSPGPNQKKKKIGRNDPCWCGSGKKWKRCCYPQQSP